MSDRDNKKQAVNTGLILSGGGARGAYQVGVLKAISEIAPPSICNPFPIISGTSAGAINAAGLASRAKNFRMAVLGLENTWSQLSSDKVFRTELWSFLRMLLRWVIPGLAAGYTPQNAALLDNTPLRHLLELVINRRRIQEAIDADYLKALCITASCYNDGKSVTFFQASPEVPTWDRVRRVGIKARIGVQHLMASSAIPFLFPAQQVGNKYYGDGALRQIAPLSPVIHLGAEKILVVGVSANTTAPQFDSVQTYPSLAQIFGHVLNSVFLDSLEGDVERSERINRTLSAFTAEEREQHGINLRPVEVLKIYPSQQIDDIAAAHLHEMPRSLRFFMRTSGGTDPSGASAASYLLFHSGFCRALIDLGYKDAMARQLEIAEFLGFDRHYHRQC